MREDASGGSPESRDQAGAAPALPTIDASFATFLETAPDATLVADASGIIRHVNELAGALFGYSRDELIGQPVEMLLPATLKETHAKHRSTFNANPRTRRMGSGDQFLAQRKNGDDFPVEVSLHPLAMDSGLLTVAAVRDISERIKLEAQLRQSQKMESVGQLAGGVAHDFNNSLSAILGYSELALTAIDPSHPLYEDLTGIKRAADQAAALTRQLLSFSRQQVLQPREIHLHELVDDLHEMLHRVLGVDILLTNRVQADLAPIIADPNQVSMVLMNLVINARDAMPTGGTLTIAADMRILGAAEATRRKMPGPGAYVEIRVSDTGAGIDPAILPQIFDPFFTTKAPGQGTGLGLATVYGVMKQSGGDIFATSVLGTGTTFTLLFPSTRVAGKQASVDDVQPQAFGGTETILLVDDEPAIRDITARILSGAGYRVLKAADGAEALQSCAEEEIELLITDVVMPVMNGAELAKQLVTHQPDLPILYISGYPDGTVASSGARVPLNKLIRKPFSANQVLMRVRKELDEGAS